MICVISVIRVPLMRSLLRTPIAGPYTQWITDPEDMIEETTSGAGEGMMAFIIFAARRFADQPPQSGPGASGARSLLLWRNWGASTDAQLVAYVRHARHTLGDVFGAAFVVAAVHAPC
jgi:hypothetical protein